jgi:hypothetical protein
MMVTNSRTSKISGTLLQALGFLANLIGAARLMLQGTSIERASGDGPSAGAAPRCGRSAHDEDSERGFSLNAAKQHLPAS